MQSKQILLLLIMGFLFFLSFSLFSNIKKRNISSVLRDTGGKADVRVDRFTFVQTHNGLKDWELKADRAELFEKDQKAYLQKVDITMNTPQGLQLVLDGDEGILDTEKKNFSLKKNIDFMVIHLNNGYTIKTSGVRWTNDKREIDTEGPAHISGPHVEVDGKEMKVTVENQEVTVSGDVKALVY